MKIYTPNIVHLMERRPSRLQGHSYVPQEQSVVSGAVRTAGRSALEAAFAEMDSLKLGFSNNSSPTFGGVCQLISGKLEYLLKRVSSSSDDKMRELFHDAKMNYLELARIYSGYDITAHRNNPLLEPANRTYDIVQELKKYFERLGQPQAWKNLEGKNDIIGLIVYLVQTPLTMASRDFGARYNTIKSQLARG